MSVNRHIPHVLILPEDDANRQLANGFVLALDGSRLNRIKVLPVAGGWLAVLDRFIADEAGKMNSYPLGLMILIIDFNGQYNTRITTAKEKIPHPLRDRVFILGTSGTPESLKQAGLGPYEVAGSLMAQDCREGTNATWGHELLRHNASELERLRPRVVEILF